MGKDSKSAPVKPGRPITEFFTRKTVSTHVPAQPKLSNASGGGQSQHLKSTKVSPPPPLEKPSISLSSDSSNSATSGTSSTVAASDASRRSRTFMEAVEIVSPPRASKVQTKSQYLQLPSNTSLKRPRSPETRNTVSPGRKSPRHGITSPTDAVVYVSKSASLSPNIQVAPFSPKENLTSASLQVKSESRKKLRLSSQSLVEDFVPSSLSDERDMVPQLASQQNHQVARRNVDEWLQGASPAEALNGGFDDTPMDVDIDVTAFSSATESSRILRDRTSSARFASPMFDREDTPPRTNLRSTVSPLPPSPMVLDGDARSAQIIADIKAKAYAASMSSPPDSPPMEFKEELDDSSDEEDLFSFSSPKRKSKSVSKLEFPKFKPPSVPAPRGSSRYALRNRGQSPSPSTSNVRSPFSSVSPPLRTTSSRGTVAPAQVRGNKQRKAYDPLEELLKEKRLADKRGKGAEALRLAEVALAGKDALLEEMKEEDWTNEEAARTAVAERERMEMKSSPLTNDTSHEDIVLDASDKQRLFGEERGKAIGDILDGDRAKTWKEKETEKVFGVPLWSEKIQDLDNHMPVNNVPQIAKLRDSHLVLQQVKLSVDTRDFTQAALIVESGAITSIDITEHPSVIPYFCELALSCKEGLLNPSSFRLLRHIWDNSSRLVPGISFACIISCLVRIGARPSVLESMGWTVAPGSRHMVPMIQRDNILYRLVSLVTSSARARRLSNDEVPDILMAMLLVSNAPSSSAELQREIMLAVDEVCQSIASGADISTPLESTICNRILNYASTLQPINKAHIVSIFEGGSGRTRRLARWIAHAIITDKSEVAVESYSDLPPLSPVLDQLTGKVYDGHVRTTPGKLEVHDKTDYVDMGFYVQILAMALTNVMAYVAQERKVPRPKPSTPVSLDSPDRPQPETILELIFKAMIALHSSISDTRAAHLERSRTKAALNEVAMRVYYQRTAALKGSTDGTGKPRGLLQYFTPSN